MLGHNGGDDMDTDREEMLRKSVCQKWEAEGRPDGEHANHLHDAENEFSTVAEEELPDREGRDRDTSTSSTDLPKVGEFESANK
jgi:hypothetical protein